MKNRLCGKNIEPCCKLCSAGRLSPDGKTVLCPRRGVMTPNDRCRRFTYDPLRRIPQKEAPLPQFSAEDFLLEDNP